MAVEVVQRETPVPGPGRVLAAAAAVVAWARAGGWALLRRKRLPLRGAGQYLLAVVGLGCITVGAFQVWVPAGWVVAGLAAFVLEYRIQEE